MVQASLADQAIAQAAAAAKQAKPEPPKEEKLLKVALVGGAVAKNCIIL